MIPARHSTKRVASVLGLSLEDSCLQAVLLLRKNGGLHAASPVQIPVDKSLWASNPEEAGRQLHQQLIQAGVRESRCTVNLPLSWATIITTPLPDLPEEDRAGFLEIEAERGFHFGQDSLAIQHSTIRCPGGERHVSMIAVARQRLDQLYRTLRAAKLRPLSFTLGLCALQAPDSEPATGILALTPHGDSIDLQITCGGGIVALRSLDALPHTKDGPHPLDMPALYRDIRVTLGQLTEPMRALVRTVKIFGDDEMSRQMARELPALLESQGVSCLAAPTCAETPLNGFLPSDLPATAHLMVAGRFLRGNRSPLEFLPPQTGRWKQLSEKISSKKLAWTGGALAAAVLVLGAMYFYQEWQLSSLEKQWIAMEQQVEELGAMQDRIRNFRPWFDRSYQSLNLLKDLTRAFPETGTVTAKTIELREPDIVTCSAEARDRQAVLDILDQLNAISSVKQLKVDQIRGGSPLQFTFNFQWNPGGPGE